MRKRFGLWLNPRRPGQSVLLGIGVALRPKAGTCQIGGAVEALRFSLCPGPAPEPKRFALASLGGKKRFGGNGCLQRKRFLPNELPARSASSSSVFRERSAPSIWPLSLKRFVGTVSRKEALPRSPVRPSAQRKSPRWGGFGTGWGQPASAAAARLLPDISGLGGWCPAPGQCRRRALLSYPPPPAGPRPPSGP